MKTVSIKKMAKELNEMWVDVNGVLSVTSDVAIHWLWKKYNKEVSFSDCFKAYKLALWDIF
jgi:hypothetical protein